MTINEGVLYWRSDSINAEQYDVRLVVSDGFERDVQEFQLSARSGIRILSKAPTLATVGEKYDYDVKVWRQRTSLFFVSRLLHHNHIFPLLLLV